MLTRWRTLRVLKRAWIYANNFLRNNNLNRDLPSRHHAIYYDSFIDSNFPAARGLLAALREGVDRSVNKPPSGSLWIERVRQTESSVSGLEDAEAFYAKAHDQAGCGIGTKQYVSMMKGGTRSIDTFSWCDALRVQETLRRNHRHDVLVSLTVLDATPSNDQCIEFWNGKCDALRLEVLNNVLLEAESRAFQSVPVWIFENRGTWKYYKQRHANLEVWANEKNVYFYQKLKCLQGDNVAFYWSYVRLLDRVWKNYLQANSLKGLS